MGQCRRVEFALKLRYVLITLIFFFFFFSVGWLKNQFAVFKEMVKQERKKDGFCVFLKSRGKSEDA